MKRQNTHNPKRQAKKNKSRRKIKKPSFKGEFLISHIAKTINQFFPDLWQRLNGLKDPRVKQGTYSLSEIVTTSIMMYIFQKGSRHAMNECRLEGRFQINIFKIFGQNIPHMDTVDAVMRELEEDELNKLKSALIHVLIDKKVLHKGRLLGMDFMVAFDGTGIHVFVKRHCDSCLTTTTKRTLSFLKEAKKLLKSAGVKQDITDCLNKFKPLKLEEQEEWKDVFENKLGRTLSEIEVKLMQDKVIIKPGKLRYFHNVLEAKLICSNGFSISLGSEWIENSTQGYDKQDCESSAFKRLSEKIKRKFPRLNICVVADGLYPNEPFFKICEKNKWRFICTFKEGNLPSLQAKIQEEISLNRNNTRYDNLQIGSVKISCIYRWINDLNYRGTKISWVECIETKTNSKNKTTVTRFVYLVSEKIEESTVIEYVKAGRLRQKIENEGFNAQKNGGYELEHKYSRVSHQATKNYYQCLQIAHMINQLCVLSQAVQKQVEVWKTTLKHCWLSMIGFIMHGNINEEKLARFLSKQTQYRYFYLP